MARSTTETIARNPEHDHCKLCGDTRVELHHIDPKGMGGSREADHPENLVALCPTHHRMVTENKITLEIIEEDGTEWILVRGENREIIAFRPRHEAKPDIAGKMIHRIRTASESILADIPLLEDEVLKQMFSIAMEMTHSSFAIECEIAYTLFSRVIGTYDEKIEAVAQYLGITKTTAYHRIRCRDAFGKGIPPLSEIPGAKPSHMMIAATTRRPQEALAILREMMSERYVSTTEYKATIEKHKKQWRAENANECNDCNDCDENQTSEAQKTSSDDCDGGTCPHAASVTVCTKHSRIVKPCECPDLEREVKKDQESGTGDRN